MVWPRLVYDVTQNAVLVNYLSNFNVRGACTIPVFYKNENKQFFDERFQFRGCVTFWTGGTRYRELILELTICPFYFWSSHDQSKYVCGWPLRVMLTGVSCSADLDWLGCLDDVSWQIVPCWDYRSNLWDRFTSNLKSLHVFRNQSHDVLWGLLKNEFLHFLCWSFKLKECHSQSRVTLFMTNGNYVLFYE